MGKRTLIDLVLILVVYVIAGACIFAVLYTWEWPQELGPTVDLSIFVPQFLNFSLGLLGISLLAALAWYVLGGWGPKAYNTSRGTWMAIWFGCLVVILIAIAVSVLIGPQVEQTNMYLLVLLYVGFGVVPYYLATVLFSPPEVKFVVIGSKLLRRGW